MQISSKKELEEAIILLEKKKLLQHSALTAQYHHTAESLKPGNLIKGAFGKIIHSPDARSGIFKTVAGLAVGVLSKKLFLGGATGFVQKLVGNALRIGVTKTAVTNSDKIKAYAFSIYNNLFRKKRHASDD